MKKNNTTEKSILNAEKLTKALKEGTEKTLQNIISEAIGNLILEGEDDEEITDEPIEDDSFEVEDVDSVEKPEVSDDEPEKDAEEASEDETEDEDDKWSDYEEFKTDDNDYDFTGEDEDAGEKLIKIFDMIEDGDEVIVTKSGDELTISHSDSDATDVVKLDSDDVEGEDDEFEVELDDEFEAESNEFDTEDESDDEGEAEDAELEIEFDDEDEESELEESTNLGYTTNYQSKTAMTTPSNKEVANPNDTYSMDDVPEGDGKRYGKSKGDSDPFTEAIHEEDEMMMPEEGLEEATNVGGAVQQRSTAKSKVPTGRKSYVPKGTKHVSFGSDYTEVVESIKKENQQLKEGLKAIKASLREAAVLNVNLGRIVNLLVNETTTRDEKKAILERFNNVKTITEGANLYNTIKSELNENKKRTVSIDTTVVAEPKKSLNETTIYQDRAKNPSLNLMDRLDNLYRR